jgi:hypothetical protein
MKNFLNMQLNSLRKRKRFKMKSIMYTDETTCDRCDSPATIILDFGGYKLTYRLNEDNEFEADYDTHLRMHDAGIPQEIYCNDCYKKHG